MVFISTLLLLIGAGELAHGFPGQPNLFAMDDDQVLLSCPQYIPSKPYSQVTIEWIRAFKDTVSYTDSQTIAIGVNSTLVAVAGARYSLMHGRDLLITKVTPSDKGEYLCRWIFQHREGYHTERFKTFLYVNDYVDSCREHTENATKVSVDTGKSVRYQGQVTVNLSGEWRTIATRLGLLVLCIVIISVCVKRKTSVGAGSEKQRYHTLSM